MIVSLKKSVRRKAMFAAALASLMLSVASPAAFAQTAAPAVQLGQHQEVRLGR